MAFAISLAIIKRFNIDVIGHECTKLFDHEIFQKYLPGYKVQSRLLNPSQFMAPANRERRYTVLYGPRVRMRLDYGTMFHRMQDTCVGDAGVYFSAPHDVVERKRKTLAFAQCKPSTSSFSELITGSMQVMLGWVAALVRAGLHCSQIFRH